MGPVKTASGDRYSVILPTFNERKNLPIVAWLLNRTFTEKYVFLPSTQPIGFVLCNSLLTIMRHQTVTSTGNSSSSTTAPPMAPKKSPSSS